MDKGHLVAANQTSETLAPYFYLNSDPQVVSVVSTGANSYGHPDPDVLSDWGDRGDVYRTQNDANVPVDGNVTATTDGKTSFTVTTSASGINKTYPAQRADSLPRPRVPESRIPIASTSEGYSQRACLCTSCPACRWTSRSNEAQS